MRITAKLCAGVVSLVFLLSACAGSPSTTHANSPTKQPTKSTAAASGFSKPKPMCTLLTGDEVSKAIGKPIVSSDDVNFFNSTSYPSLCNYHLDKDNLVKLQWMSKEEALWDVYIANLGTSEASGAVSVRVPGAQLGGDDAVKETTTLQGITAVVYTVLIEKRNLVIQVSDTNGLPDDKLRALTRAAVQKL